MNPAYTSTLAPRRRSLLGWIACLLLLSTACNSPEQTQPDKPIESPKVEPQPEPPKPKPMSEFERMFRDSGLVDLAEYIPGIRIDLKYTTRDNFVKADVYGDLDKCFMRPEAAEKLKKAQELLQEKHPAYSLLVFDGVRPFRVQQFMWDSLHIPNKRNYLAPPAEGSIHNYGCAVDLSIADSLGNQLDMGTPFDFFGELAQPQLEGKFLANGQLTKEQHANRLLLRDVMRRSGFSNIKTEWWHFNAFASSSVKAKFTRLP